MAAWLSALGDRWSCSSCTRRGFVCSRAGRSVDMSEVECRLAEAPVPASVPAVFRADAASVCPRVLVGPMGNAVSDAYGWRENGGLGLTYLTAPMWVGQALAQFGSELMKAVAFKTKQSREK